MEAGENNEPTSERIEDTMLTPDSMNQDKGDRNEGEQERTNLEEGEVVPSDQENDSEPEMVETHTVATIIRGTGAATSSTSRRPGRPPGTGRSAIATTPAVARAAAAPSAFSCPFTIHPHEKKNSASQAAKIILPPRKMTSGTDNTHEADFNAQLLEVTTDLRSEIEALKERLKQKEI